MKFFKYILIAILAMPVVAFGQQCKLVQAVKMTPRLFSFKTQTPGEIGWHPFNKMIFSMTIKNVGNQAIAFLSFQLNYPNRLHPLLLQTNWDDVSINIKPGEEKTIFMPTVVDMYSLPSGLTVTVTKVVNGEGMILNVPWCDLGSALLPPPFQAPAAQANSPIQVVGKDVTAPVLLLGGEITLPPIDDLNTRRGQKEFQKRRGQKAIVSFIVSESGEPLNITIKQGTSSDAVNKAIVQGISKWYFAPALRDNKPVAVQIRLVYSIR